MIADVFYGQPLTLIVNELANLQYLGNPAVDCTIPRLVLMNLKHNIFLLLNYHLLNRASIIWLTGVARNFDWEGPRFWKKIMTLFR